LDLPGDCVRDFTNRLPVHWCGCHQFLALLSTACTL